MPIFGKDNHTASKKDAKDFYSKALDAGLTPKEAEDFIKGVEAALHGFMTTSPRFHDSMDRVKALTEDINASDILKLDAERIEKDRSDKAASYREAMLNALNKSEQRGVRLHELKDEINGIWNRYLFQTIGHQRELWEATECQIGMLCKICTSSVPVSLSKLMTLERYGSDIMRDIGKRIQKNNDFGFHLGTSNWLSWRGGYFIQYAGTKGEGRESYPDENLGVALLFFQFRGSTILLNGKEYPVQFLGYPGGPSFAENYEAHVKELAESCLQSPWLYVDPQGNASLGDYRNLRREK